MKAYLAKSYQEIFNLVSEIKHSHFESKEIWFREQGSSEYMLKPSLLRTRTGIDKEREPFPARYPIAAKCDSINQRVFPDIQGIASHLRGIL